MMEILFYNTSRTSVQVLELWDIYHWIVISYVLSVDVY